MGESAIHIKGGKVVFFVCVKSFGQAQKVFWESEIVFDNFVYTENDFV